MSGACLDCAATLGPANKSGRCRSCLAKHNNANPACRAKQAAGIAAHFDKPGIRAAYAARIKAAQANETPEARAWRRENGRRIAREVLNRPELRAIVNDPAMKAANGRKRTDTVLAWCPPPYRDRYRHLKNTKLLRAAEARRVIEDEIAADKARALAAMTPHERQLAKVRAGARLVDRFIPRRADHDFTIGGVAPEVM